jgi:hypothetical protein
VSSSTSPSSPHHERRPVGSDMRSRLALAIPLALAAALFVASLFVGWWQWTSTATTPSSGSAVYTYTRTFRPGSDPVLTNCYNSSCTFKLSSYASIGFPSLGMLYEVALVLIVAAIAAGVVATALVLAPAVRGSGIAGKSLLLAASAVASLFGLGSVFGLFFLQPPAMWEGQPYPPGPDTVGSSFFGSRFQGFWGGPGCQASNCPVVDTWGPALGWYLALAASILFAVVVVIEVRETVRRRRANPANAEPLSSPGDESPPP